MVTRDSRGGVPDQNTITKPKIIKNWLILGGSVVGILLLLLWAFWPGKSAGPTGPDKPGNPLSGVAAPRDDKAETTFLGVTPDGRYVVATWRHLLTAASHGTPPDNRPPVDDK